MANEPKYVSGADIINLLAPMLGIKPGDVAAITVNAKFDDESAFFTVTMFGRSYPVMMTTNKDK